MAFSALEVIERRGKARQSRVLELQTLREWAAESPVARRVETLLTRLCEPRTGPAGTAFDRPLIMGVVNVTPDSFSDGGEHLDPDRALARARELVEAGADIIDVGAESTRPGAQAVSAPVELERIAPVLGRIAERSALLSIDTRRAAVMSLALSHGARMINDVSALRADPDSLGVAAGSSAHVALMHMPGDLAALDEPADHDDVALAVFDWLEARVETAVAAGIARARLIVDPGIAFGKSGADNLAILRQLALFHGLGCPILLGVSRKGLTGAFERAHAPKDRLPGSLAAALQGLAQGVQIFRVHDVAETRQALRVWQAIGG